MYVALIAVLLCVSVVLFLAGLRRRNRALLAIGIIMAAATVAFFWFLGFWGEVLWFDAVGYVGRFWTVVLAKLLLTIAGAVIAAGLVHLLTFSVARDNLPLRFGSRLFAALIGGYWGLSNWDTVLLYLNRVRTGEQDPILGHDAGFYLFTLPLYDAIYSLLFATLILALAIVAIGALLRFRQRNMELRNISYVKGIQAGQYRSLYATAVALLILLAWGKYLDRFHLMYSTLGVVTGPGWTDVHVRLPMYTVMVALLLATALLLVLPPIHSYFHRWAGRFGLEPSSAGAAPLAASVLVLGMAWLILLAVVPGLFQWLYVQPNEITVERPYLVHNIAFTRRAFNLHEASQSEFPVSEEFTRRTVEQNEGTFNNIRLWDWRALDAVYKQFQEIRLYYEFHDVDVDRYTVGDDYRQVMVSAREMELANLPAQSQTFVNRRFKYTHGYGITLVPVNEFTPEGLPRFLIRDIPPVAAHPSLQVEQPSLYYGELTRTHVIANSQEEEFDYPSGAENVYVHYEGTGGVQLHNLWRRFLFGWKFDGTRLFVSSYPTSQSRILFHRRIQERVRLIAPFLQFDRDPYIVLADGRLFWIIDAYTTSSNYPYSEPFRAGLMTRYEAAQRFFEGRYSRLRGINYIRNSVKVVVDAYHGMVDLYIFDDQDPLIQAWRRVFPNLLKSRSQMPPFLYRHIRYPIDLLLIQGLMYAKYHMTDPVVFYNQEDLWVLATETYYGNVQPVEPYYIMWEPPGTDRLEFVLMLPFTPRNRQVLIGWIAGLCDPPNYGRLLAYKFPKEGRVLGTQQVETKIDQDPYLSAQLSLWDQRGSRVIRGNVLVIPVGDTLVYIEPIYLQAEAAAYPELRLVAIMHNDRLSYAPTFAEALQGLLRQTEGRPAPADKAPVEVSIRQLVQRANEALSNYLQALGEGQFRRAADELQSLQDTLQRLSEIQGLPQARAQDANDVKNANNQ